MPSNVYLKKAFFKKLLKNNEKFNICVIFIFIVSIIIRLIYFSHNGLNEAGDTSFYIKSAESIINKGLTYYIHDISHAYYWLYQTLLALMLKLFGEKYYYIILVQIVIDSLGTIFICKMGKRVFNSGFVGILSGLIYAAYWEIFRWDTYILTDSIGCLLGITSVYLLIKHKDKADKKNLYFLILNMVLLIFARPTSFPLLVILIGFLVAELEKGKRIYSLSILVSSFLMAVIGVILTGDSDRIGILGYFKYFSDLYKNGIIITGMPEYDYYFIKGASGALVLTIHYIAITIYKAVMYWAVIIGRHSLAHKLLEIIMLVPLYIFSVIGIVKSLKQKNSYTKILIFVILAYNIFHALTEVDFDWRYRVPVLPFLIILASYGFSVLLFNFITKNKNNIKELAHANKL